MEPPPLTVLHQRDRWSLLYQQYSAREVDGASLTYTSPLGKEVERLSPTVVHYGGRWSLPHQEQSISEADGASGVPPAVQMVPFSNSVPLGK